MSFDNMVLFSFVLTLLVIIWHMIVLVSCLEVMSPNRDYYDRGPIVRFTLFLSIAFFCIVIKYVLDTKIDEIDESKTTVCYRIESIQQTTRHVGGSLFYSGHNEDMYVISANGIVYRCNVSSTPISSGDSDEIQINEYSDGHYDLLNVILSPNTAEELGIILPGEG